MLRSVVDMVECNPRSIKRLVNLLQIISEIAKLKPMTGLSSGATIATWESGEEWRKFSKKAVMWVFMAQNFTFRLGDVGLYGPELYLPTLGLGSSAAGL